MEVGVRELTPSSVGPELDREGPVVVCPVGGLCRRDVRERPFRGGVLELVADALASGSVEISERSRVQDNHQRGAVAAPELLRQHLDKVAANELRRVVAKRRGGGVEAVEPLVLSCPDERLEQPHVMRIAQVERVAVDPDAPPYAPTGAASRRS